MGEYTCRHCSGHQFYTDEERVRHCIPCENKKEERLRARKAKWEKKRPPRDRRAYHKEYRRLHK